METTESSDRSLIADDPLIRNCRSALLEEENVRLKSAINAIRGELSSSSYTDADLIEKIKGIVNDEDLTKKDTLLRRQNVLSHVRAELEHERRLRTQEALDEAERRCYQLGKELEHKVFMYEEKLSDLESNRKTLTKDVDELQTEKNKLSCGIKVKESELKDSELKSKELIRKANEFEKLFNGQLEIVKVLQNDLTIASAENKGLVKEMELLNKMFNELERTHVTEALKDYKDEDSAEIVLFKNALLKEEPPKASTLDDPTRSCFKEVTTKNGTRMVLSVSKTFMKLQDLILEKKTLEDEVEKMKNINAHLANKVNLHEAKLFNITDELNKTWNYVSTLKTQHSQLHTSELILRAELAEKRNLLAKLREELEYSRESWNIVKQKTAESEREWRSLRDEFAARRLAFKPFQPTTGYTSSESGYSDRETPESPIKNDEESVSEEDEPPKDPPQEGTDSDDTETEESSNHPSEEPHVFSTNMTESTITLLSPEEEEDIQSGGGSSLVLIPSLSYLANVPSSLMPPLLSNEEEDCEEIYQKLIQSTSRSAALANRLAEINRQSEDASDNEEEEGVPEEDEQEEEEEDGLENPFGSSESLNAYIQKRGGTDALVTDTTLSSVSDDDYSSCCDLEEEGEEDLEPTLFHEEEDVPSPVPALPPNISGIIPPASIIALSREDLSDGESDNPDADQLSESATTVTRFLIKHLPKQLSRLRTDKTELEEKVRGLEARISEQSVAMSELDRRNELFKCEALQNKSSESSSNTQSTSTHFESESQLDWTISRIEGNVLMFLSSQEDEPKGHESIVLSSNASPHVLTFKEDERLICKVKVIFGL